MEDNETLKLAEMIRAIGREHGKKTAKKYLDKITDEEFARAKQGETIDLTSLWCGAEAVGKIQE